MLRGDTIRMAGVQQNISYLKALLPGDLVLVKSKLIEMRERTLKMLHEMRHVESGELCATPRSFPPEIAARTKEIL